MLNITRTWNAVAASWMTRRAMALAKDYATRRVQFGAHLNDKPLHVDTLAGMQAESDALFLLAFLAVETLGRIEAGTASDADKVFLRLLTPLTKLTTAKMAMYVAPETLEAFGGAGFIEDTGVPVLLRDAQVLPIWEGTTNVLSLDALKVLAKDGALDLYREQVETMLAKAHDPSLKPVVKAAEHALSHAAHWIGESLSNPVVVEAGARRFALTLGRTLALARMVEHAQWSLDHNHGSRAAASARRFARNGVDLIQEIDPDDSRLLV
jgi:hypothetical protein